MKNFEDFKQEVAKYKGFKSVYDLVESRGELSMTYIDMLNKAAELWGQYCREEGETKGWNDALHWAADNAIVEAIIGDKGIINYRVNNDSILSGLKSTDSNKNNHETMH